MFTAFDSHKARNLLLGLFLAGTSFYVPVSGQNNLNLVFITTQVSGPFYPYESLNDLKAHTIVTVTATYSNDAQYDMSLTGTDNDISFHLTNKLDLNFPRTFNGANGDLDNFFSAGDLTFANVDTRNAYSNGLPPGTYDLCFQVWNYDGTPATKGPPVGCATFTIPAVSATITSSFSAPYNTPLSSINNQVVVTATANSDINNGILTVNITGDNGVIIKSSPYAPDYFTLNRNVPKVITGTDLSGIFDIGALDFTGISAQDAMNKTLPPGNYSMCFRFWLNQTTPASPDAPSGCSNFSLINPSVTATTQVIPPYAPGLDNYPEKTMLTLQSNTNIDVKLAMQLKGDNGITINTAPGYTPMSLISLTANVPYVVSPGELSDYFDPAHLIVQGMSQQALASAGLPEGNYRLCFQVFDAKGQPLSQGDPAGCSNMFTISYPEPPQLVNPVCDAQLPDNGVQNIVFSWTPPPGAPPTTEYTLRIVEIDDPELSPDQAMQSATTPAFFEEQVNGLSFFYGPAQPLLEKGKRYAWQVIAEDNTTNVQFKNNGKSQVCSFTWGTENPAPNVESGLSFEIFKPSGKVDTVGLQRDLYSGWGWLYNGNLFKADSVAAFKTKDIQKYRLTIHPGKQKSGRKTDPAFSYQTTITKTDTVKNWAVSYFQRSMYELQQMGLKNDYWYNIEVEAMNSSNAVVATKQTQDFRLVMVNTNMGPMAHITGQLSYKFDSFPDNYPIPNTSIRFYPANQVSKTLPNAKPNSGSLNPQLTGQEFYAKTDGEGRFQLDVAKPDSSSKNIKYRMEIESPYYQPIDSVFTITDSTQELKLAPMITKAYSYSLKIYLKKGFSSYKKVYNNSYWDEYNKKYVHEYDTVKYYPDSVIQEIPAGVTVKMYRKQRPSYLPPVEGQFASTKSENGLIMVAEGKTVLGINKNGKKVSFVKFDKLLCNVYSDDVYYIKAVDSTDQDVNGDPKAYQVGPFTAPEKNFRYEKPASAGDSTHFNVAYTYKIISTDPPKSTISGQLVYVWPGDKSGTPRPLANEEFSVVVEYLYNNKPVRIIEPVANGTYKTALYLNDRPPKLNTYDYGKIMATGKTDNNGHFVIQAVNLNAKGLLGKGTSITTGGPKPPNSQLPGGIPDPNQMIISPEDPSEMGEIGQLSGMEDLSIFNFSQKGSAFGAQVQAGMLNGEMNSKLGMGMNQQKFQGYNTGENWDQLYETQQDPLNKKLASLPGPYDPQMEAYSKDNSSEGEIRRVFRIRVGDQDFYYNPDKNIEVQPLKEVNAGTITVRVKEVKWNFTAVDENSGVTLSKLKAVIARDPASKVKGLPEGEGDGLYRMKKLINPQYTGEVNLPKSAPPPNSGNGSGMAQGGNWQKNMQNISYQEVPTSVLLNGKQSWPDDYYEWLENSETGDNGVVSFARLVSGFKDYFLEISSDPSKGQYFYNPTLMQLDADNSSIEYGKDAKNKEITAQTNTTYGNYWDTRRTDVPVAYVKVSMIPKPGRVGGRVIDKSTGLGIKYALVKINDSKEQYLTGRFTDSTGYFQVLNVFDLPGVPKNHANLTVRMRAYATGYVQQKGDKNLDYKYGTVGKTGKQFVTEIVMVPSDSITGFVKNEQGDPVDAYVQRKDGLTVETMGFNGELFFMNRRGEIINDTKGKFTLPMAVKPGATSIFYIIPKDPGYFADTVYVKNTKTGINDVGVQTVYRRAHRIHFLVTDKDNANLKIAGAQIFVNKQQSVQTDRNGEAQLSFENVSVNNYTITITGPKGKGYISQVINLKNEESKTTQNYWIKLKKGGSVSGVVTLNGNPVEGAKVYLDYKEQNTSQPTGYYQVYKLSSVGDQTKPPTPNAKVLGNGTLPQIAAYSDKNGHYQLDGIPVNSGQVTMIATLDTTFTVIGDKKVVTFTSGHATQDLALKSYGNMLIKSIYGFPLSVESISTTNNNDVVNVTGIVKLDKSKSPFGWITNEQDLRIHDVPFQKTMVKGQAIGIPVNNQASLDAVSNLKMQYLHKYNVQVTHDAGGSSGKPSTSELTIQRQNDNKGEMLGYVHIVDNSFNYPSSYLNFKNKDQFFLCQASKNKVDNHLSVFNAFGTDEQPDLNPSSDKLLTAQSFHLCNNQDMPIKFSFIQFDASADPQNSYIEHDGKIHLDVSMDCHIPNAQPDHFTVHAGDIVLDNNKVYPAAGAKPLEVDLEKGHWKLEVSDWTIDPQKGGIYSEKGLIKTGKLDIPFSEFNLRADMFVMKNFDINDLELGGGVKKLSNIAAGTAVMVYDTKSGSDMSGHWKLSIPGKGNNPAAVIKDLTPFLNNNIEIEYIQLLSNGEDIFTIKQSPTPTIIKYNHVAKFSPQDINSGSDFFTITGGLSIPAPRLVPIMTTLKFKGKPSSLTMEVEPIQMKFEGKGYVDFDADESTPPTIIKNQIVIKGQVEEQNGFNPIPATFYADGSEPSSAYYHVDLQKGFVLKLNADPTGAGATKEYNLIIDHGGEDVPKNDNDWSLLSYTGNLDTDDNTLNTGGNNKNKNKMTFTVHGDISVNGDSMSVSNIKLPFGTMSMVYDFPSKTLHGTLQVDDQKLGPFTAGGTIEMQMAPQGWYFLGACKINTGMPGPFSSMNMGFLIGHSPVGQEALDEVTQYSFDKTSLCWLQNGDNSSEINGFFITAGKNLIDKDLGIDLGIAKIYLEAKAGGEASLYTVFSPFEINLSAGLYGEVFAGAAALNVSANGSASLNGSMTGVVSAQEYCIGGKIQADVSGDINVDLAVKTLSASFSKHAVVKLILSSQGGVSTSFDFGSGGATPDCKNKSKCGN